MKRAPGSYLGLTHMQAELLSFVRHRQSNGVTPSFDEMKDGLGLASKSGVSRLVNALVERGYLTRIENRHRAVRANLFAQPVDVPQPERVSIASFSTEQLMHEMQRRGFRIGMAA